MVQLDKNGRMPELEPFTNKQILSDAGWCKMKNSVLEMNKEQLNNINR